MPDKKPLSTTAKREPLGKSPRSGSHHSYSLEKRAAILELIRDNAIEHTLSYRQIRDMLAQDHDIHMSNVTVREYVKRATRDALTRLDDISDDLAVLIVRDLLDNWHDLQAIAAELDITKAIAVVNDSMGLADDDAPKMRVVQSAERVIRLYMAAMGRIDKHAERIDTLTGIGIEGQEPAQERIIIMKAPNSLTIADIED